MRDVLRPVKQFSANYVDDTAVYSDAWLLHLMHLQKFLATIRTSGFTFNIKKCIWAKPEVKFVGRIVGSGKHRPDTSKIEAIANLKKPKTKKEVRQI